MDDEVLLPADHVSWLLSYLAKLEDENYKLKLALGLIKKPKGRPKKANFSKDIKEPHQEKRGRPSKNLTSGEQLLSEVENLKKRFGVTRDTEVIKALICHTAKSEKISIWRTETAKIRKWRKGILNRISEARNPKNKK